MLNKYNAEFKEMNRRIEQNESPLKVISNYIPLFEKEGIGPWEIINYLNKFIQKK